MTHHAKLDRWFQLGGHCDEGHDLLNVAIKEAQEESGINNIVPLLTAPGAAPEIFDIDIHLIPENKKEKAHYHYDIRFLLKVISNEEVIQSSESKALKWIKKDIQDLPTKNYSVMKMFNK